MSASAKTAKCSSIRLRRSSSARSTTSHVATTQFARQSHRRNRRRIALLVKCENKTFSHLSFQKNRSALPPATNSHRACHSCAHAVTSASRRKCSSCNIAHACTLSRSRSSATRARCAHFFTLSSYENKLLTANWLFHELCAPSPREDRSSGAITTDNLLLSHMWRTLRWCDSKIIQKK